MGREIRRVPPGWEHPIQERCPHNYHKNTCYQPLYDEDFESAARAWLKGFDGWRASGKCDEYYWEMDSPPERNYYRERAWTKEEATHYQVYETVSEGTPVTPHFATKGELIDYLEQHGDFWDQVRGDGGWQRVAAERFIEREWAPSFITNVQPGVVEVLAPRDGA